MKEIQLNRGMVALVDDDIFDYINKWKWTACRSSNNFYARKVVVLLGKRNTIYMHRLVADAQINDKIDHIDGNSLNNQLSNLRLCTSSQNSMNSNTHKNSSSIYKGVSWYSRCNNWMAKICLNRKQIYLGYFKTEEDAARAYDIKAQELFGEFAKLNF